jgi:hypothetical protein
MRQILALLGILLVSISVAGGMIIAFRQPELTPTQLLLNCWPLYLLNAIGTFIYILAKKGA